MSKQSIRVMIGREVQLISPGMLGRKFDFNSGYSFLTQEWFYPGELHVEGDLAEKPRYRWSFGTNTGGDLPLFFGVEDLQEVIIPSDSETIQIFKEAPFKVTIKCQ